MNHRLFSSLFSSYILGFADFLRYPCASSWQIRTLWTNSLPWTNTHWLLSMTFGMTSFSLMQISFVIYLYIKLHHEMRWNSLSFCGFETFGSKTILVAFICFSSLPFWKNSITASHTICPTMFQFSLKKLLLCPSGLVDWQLLIEKITFLMSSLVSTEWSTHMYL